MSGLLLRVPKFSKYLHGVASLYPNRIEAIPYWFLPADKDGYVMTPASWEEMADPKDPYLKVGNPCYTQNLCHDACVPCIAQAKAGCIADACVSTSCCLVHAFFFFFFWVFGIPN